MNNNEPRRIHDIVKVYPNMIQIYIYHDSYSLPTKRKSNKLIDDNIKKAKKDDSIHRSVRRSRSVISDLIVSNRFDLWTTFTFDPKKYNRYDIARCKQIMSQWLHRQRLHSPDFRYLIVPELHKDGAIHFHALLANFNGSLVPTKLKQRTNTVYKLSGFRAGRSHAIHINNTDTDYAKVSNYIKKYITKDMILIDSRKRYWASRNLKRPETFVNGVAKFRFEKLIFKNKPSYVNEHYELQEFPIQPRTPLGRDIETHLPDIFESVPVRPKRSTVKELYSAHLALR